MIPYYTTSLPPHFPYEIIHTVTHLAFTHLPKQTRLGKAENRLGLDWDEFLQLDTFFSLLLLFSFIYV